MKTIAQRKTQTLGWLIAVAIVAAVGSCRAAVSFSWNGSDCDGYWLICVSNGRTNLLADTPRTNATVAQWPNGAVSYVLATNRCGGISKPSNMLTNTPESPQNLKRK